MIFVEVTALTNKNYWARRANLPTPKIYCVTILIFVDFEPFTDVASAASRGEYILLDLKDPWIELTATQYRSYSCSIMERLHELNFDTI